MIDILMPIFRNPPVTSNYPSQLLKECAWTYANAITCGQQKVVQSLVLEKGFYELAANVLRSETDLNFVITLLAAILETLECGDATENGTAFIELAEEAALDDEIRRLEVVHAQMKSNESVEILAQAASCLERFSQEQEYVKTLVDNDRAESPIRNRTALLSYRMG